MKRMLQLVGAIALVPVVFGYTVSMTSAPDATATSSAANSSGWSLTSQAVSAGADRDLRQTTWAESEVYAGSFDSRKPGGCVLYFR